jgi:hypothetical protein
MMEVKNSQLDLIILPAHNCKQNLIIIEETHSVNNSHNIVIARIHQCKVCGKKFESYDPNGLDKIIL